MQGKSVSEGRVAQGNKAKREAHPPNPETSQSLSLANPEIHTARVECAGYACGECQHLIASSRSQGYVMWDLKRIQECIKSPGRGWMILGCS